MALWRVRVGERDRLAVGEVATGPRFLLDDAASVAELLGGPSGLFQAAVEGPATAPVPAGARVLVPVDGQEVWAAGVTYERSRDARREESGGADCYDRVYAADRPELFAKAAPGRARGPGEQVAIRRDSTWDVPEPELGVVADRHGAIVAYVVGNDVSSRSIEGENPLYLPQAKVYTGSCALGPCLVPVAEAPPLDDIRISLTVLRSGAAAFEGSVGVDALRRPPADLVAWLYLASEFPAGVVLLTGTGLVPAGGFTLEEGDEVVISATGLGELRNTVARTGRPTGPSAPRPA